MAGSDMDFGGAGVRTVCPVWDRRVSGVAEQVPFKECHLKLDSLLVRLHERRVVTAGKSD